MFLSNSPESTGDFLTILTSTYWASDIILQPFSKASITTWVLVTEWQMSWQFCLGVLAGFTHCFQADRAIEILRCHRLNGNRNED
jgi:hypothetical protein